MFELVNLDFYNHWWWAVWALARLNTSSYRNMERVCYGTRAVPTTSSDWKFYA